MRRKITVKAKPIERVTENSMMKFYMPANGGLRYFGKSDIIEAPKAGKEITIVLSDNNSKLVDEFLRENVVPTVIGINTYGGLDNYGNCVLYDNIYECIIGKCNYHVDQDKLKKADESGKLPRESVNITFIPKSFRKIHTLSNRVKFNPLKIEENKEKTIVSDFMSFFS